MGSILYLASQTRPDLLYSTNQLSRRSNKTTAQEYMNTFIPYTDSVNLISIGSLLSSKAIFNVVYDPDGFFKKFKAPLVAR